jgi:uncharacterized FlaG/YvyC family protein
MAINGVNGADSTLPAIPTSAVVPQEQTINNRALIQAVKVVNEAGTLGNNKEVTFQIDRTTKLPVIQIVDRSTNQVVDQIPSEYILQLAQNLGKGESRAPSGLP